MTSPVRPTNTPRRRTLAEIRAEMDEFLRSVELEEPTASTPVAAPAPRRSLLDGFTPPKVSVASDATDRMGTNDPRRRATFDYTNAPDANTLLTRGREAQQQPGEIRRALESTGRVGKAVSGAIGGTQEFVPNAIAGAGSSATGIAAGALRLPGRATRAITGSPRETNEADQSTLDRTASTLEQVSRGIDQMVPIRSGAGVAGRMIGGAAPYMIPGAAGARFGTELLAGGALTALESVGNSASSATRALGEWEKLRRSNSEEESWFDPALRAAGRIAESETARPLVDGVIDMTLGAAPRGIKRLGEQIDRIRPRAAAPSTPFSPAPTLDATRPASPPTRYAERPSDMAEPDLDAWRETTFGSATFDDPMRTAQNELDTQRAAYDAAQARARQQRQAMAARGRAAGDERALRDEQVQVDALREQIPPLPRTTPTSADVDAEARSMEAWARRIYGVRDKLNTAVDAGTDENIIAELDKLVRARPGVPLRDLSAQLDPQRATPQLDEVGQQLDEAGREALDAQQAAANMNPKVRTAREKLNTALDSGDDTKVSRALRELAKLQDQGLYAAAPVGLAVSQNEDEEGANPGMALAAVGLGAVAFKNGKRVVKETADLASDAYKAGRDTARLRAAELTLDTPRFGAFGGKNLDDEIDELRARGETERADNMEKAFGQSVVRVPLFHGTPANFTVPDPSKARAEGFAGKTFYLTTNPYDAGGNYAKADIYDDATGEISPEKMDWQERRASGTGFGPDLNFRFDDDFDQAWDYALAELRDTGELDKLTPEQLDRLKQQMVADSAKRVANSDMPAGNVMPMYADVRNPLVTNGDNATVFTRENWKGAANQLRKALGKAGADFDGETTEALVSLRQQLVRNGQLTYTDVRNAVSSFVPDPEMAAEAVDEWVRGMGYDALITDAARQFPGMKLTPGTLHVQVFDPNAQIKSATGNRGTFDMSNPDVRYGAAAGAGVAATSEDEDTRNMALGVAGMALGTSKVGRAGLAKAAKAAGDIAQRLTSEAQPWSRASIELATMKDARFSGIENLPEGEALELQIGAQRMVSEKIAKGLGLKEGRDFRASPSHGLWFSEDGNAPVQPSLLLEFSPGVDKAKALAFVAEQSRIMKQAGMFYMDVADDGARQALDFVVRDKDGEVMHASQYLDIIKEGRAGWNGATVLDDGNRTMIVFDDGIDAAATVAEFNRFQQLVEDAGFTLDREGSFHVRVNAEEVGEQGYTAIVDRSGVRGQAWRESVREAERLYEGVAITAEKRIAGQRIKNRPDAQSLTLNLEPESLAAVKVGRMVFTGRNHLEAFGKAQQAVKQKKVSARALTEARDNPASSGYTLDNGEFVTRFEGEAVLEIMEDRGDDLASRALGKIQEREADGATSWLRSEDFKSYRSMLGPAATGAAAASLLAPSDAEAQGTGVGEAAGGVGGMLAVAAGSGAAALGARKLIGRSSNKLIGRVANGAERFLRETDPLTNARPGNFTSNLERVQRAAYSKPLQGPSQVNPDDWFRMDKASPDADRQRLAEAIEVVVATSGVAVQKADRLGNPVAGKPTITWDEVRTEARRLQVDPDRLIEAARQRGWSPAEALAGRTVIGDNVNVIAAIEQRLASQQLSVEEAKKLAGVLEQYENQTNRLLEVYTTERSAAGRLLNSYKIVANQTLDPSVWTSRAFKANGGALTSQQLVDLNGFIKSQDRAGLAKFVADLHKPSAGELFGAFLKAGMLMSPKTHITNFASNALMTGMEVVKDAPAAAADKMLRTLVNAVDPDKAGARRTKDFSPVAMAKASLSGARKGAAEAAKILRGESVNNQMARWDAKGEAFVRTGNAKADAFFNLYLNAPFRALSAGDRIFRQAALERSIAEQQRVVGTQAVTDDMMLQAIADAEFATFQQRTAVGEAAQSAKRGLVRGAAKGGAFPELAASAVAETTLPFVKTPAAVLSSSVEYAAGIAATPNDIARLLTEAKKGIKDPNQAAIVAALQKRAAERLGRQAVGALALTTGWVLAANGLLSAPVPLQKKKERDTGQMLGNAPGGSLQVGEETKVSVDRISPIGNLLTAGAAIFNELQDPQNPWADAVASGVFSMGAAMLDNSFLQGVQDVQRATTDEGGFGRLAENRALSAVPFNSLLRSVSRVVDPTVRDAQTLDERFLAGIPFASRSLSPKRDPLGNEITRPRGGMAVLNEIVPGTLSVDRSARDPQARLLRDLDAMLTRPARDKNKETVEEFREREQVLGAATRRELDRLQRLPSWNQMSDEAKRDRIDTRISTVRSQATQKFRRGRVTVPQEGLRPNVAGGGGGSRF